MEKGMINFNLFAPLHRMTWEQSYFSGEISKSCTSEHSGQHGNTDKKKHQEWKTIAQYQFIGNKVTTLSQQNVAFEFRYEYQFQFPRMVYLFSPMCAHISQYFYLEKTKQKQTFGWKGVHSGNSLSRKWSTCIWAKLFDDIIFIDVRFLHIWVTTKKNSIDHNRPCHGAYEVPAHKSTNYLFFFLLFYE